MNSPFVPVYAWRACLLAAATVSPSSADAQVANSHVARSWAGTWDRAPARPPLAPAAPAFSEQASLALRLQVTRDLLAQQAERLVSRQPVACALGGIEGSAPRTAPDDRAAPGAHWHGAVLAAAGAGHVIMLPGIGDLVVPGRPASNAGQAARIEELIAGYRQLIARTHARGLVICGATMTPFDGALRPAYCTPGREQLRQGVNHWLRSSGEFDAVVDFDHALRDPRQPARLLPAYDSGDHLHPNAAGMQAMAGAIPAALFGAPATVRQRRAMTPAGAAVRATSGCVPLPPPGAA